MSRVSGFGTRRTLRPTVRRPSTGTRAASRDVWNDVHMPLLQQRLDEMLTSDNVECSGSGLSSRASSSRCCLHVSCTCLLFGALSAACSGALRLQTTHGLVMFMLSLLDAVAVGQLATHGQQCCARRGARSHSGTCCCASAYMHACAVSCRENNPL